MQQSVGMITIPSECGCSRGRDDDDPLASLGAVELISHHLERTRCGGSIVGSIALAPS